MKIHTGLFLSALLYHIIYIIHMHITHTQSYFLHFSISPYLSLSLSHYLSPCLSLSRTLSFCLSLSLSSCIVLCSVLYITNAFTVNFRFERTLDVFKLTLHIIHRLPFFQCSIIVGIPNGNKPQKEENMMKTSNPLNN